MPGATEAVMKKGKVLILDAMGVIYTVGDDTNELLAPFVRRKNPEVPHGRIVELYMRASLGAITSETFWREVGLGAEYPYVETEYLFTRIHIDRDLYSIIPRLRRSCALAMLSNDVSEWSAILRRKYRLDEFFSGMFISGDLKTRKPGREIYERALRGLQCAPGDCIFVDDKRDNLLPARELGMKVVWFSRDGNDGDDAIDRVSSLLELPGVVERLCGGGAG